MSGTKSYGCFENGMAPVVFSVILFLCLMIIAASAQAAPGSPSQQNIQNQDVGRDFNHAATAFPLAGAHLSVDCGGCHVGGLFKGTPKNCSGCHSKGRRVIATTMSTRHITTSDPCEVCHTNAVTFYGIKFSHSAVRQGGCDACHNGLSSTGKPASHSSGAKATSSCDTCHRPNAWLPATFSHASVVPGTCATCHSAGGGSSVVKPVNHIGVKATQSCDACHRTTAWLPTITFSHAGVVAGTCATCHSTGGGASTVKPASHSSGSKATSSCDTCHRTSAWLPATYDHSTVSPGSCVTCHVAGGGATGKPASHSSGIKATSSCDACHRTTAWLPTTFNHASVVPGTCATCHSAGGGATSKPASHSSGSKATSSCDTCHKTTAWLPATGGHTGNEAGLCFSCHSTTSKSITYHPASVTGKSCDICHTTSTAPNVISSWSPYRHSALQGYGTCVACHSDRGIRKHGAQVVTPGSKYYLCDSCHTVNSWDR